MVMEERRTTNPERKLLVGKTAIVTGGASGIGKAIAEEFLRQGARVAIFDISGSEVVNELSELGEVAYFNVDVSEEKQIKRGFKEAQWRFGVINVLVNNAGIDPNSPLEELSSEQWDRVMSVNLKGSFLMTKCFGEALIETGKKGSIIFISSIHTAFAFAGETSYDASKLGMIGLMRGVALEWGRHGINANAIAPGAIYPTGITEGLTADEKSRMEKIIPIGRVGDPGDIAHVASFLASDRASYIHGAEIRVDGGLAIKNPLVE